MTALSDFLENRLLGTSLLGSETYVLPYIISVNTVSNATLYEFYINDTQIDFTSDADATESEIITGLETDVNSGGGSALPVTASQFTDVDGNLKLKIAGDGTHANFWLGSDSAELTVEGQSVYAALFTTATDDAAGGTEVAGGVGYTREKVPFNSPASGATDNSADVTFGPATASWGTVTHVALYDDFTGGNRLFHGALTSSKTIDTSDSFVFRTGDLDLSMD